MQRRRRERRIGAGQTGQALQSRRQIAVDAQEASAAYSPWAQARQRKYARGSRRSPRLVRTVRAPSPLCSRKVRRHSGGTALFLSGVEPLGDGLGKRLARKVPSFFDGGCFALIENLTFRSNIGKVLEVPGHGQGLFE